VNTLRTKIILAVAALLVSIPAFAAPVSVGVEADFASRYIWRGFDVYDNGGAFQPSGFVAYAPTDALSVTGSVWASYNMDVTETLDEVDYTLDVSYTISDMISVSAGAILYVFPEVSGDDNTSEAYGSVSLTLPSNLSASAAIYYDYDDGDGYYVNCGLEYGVALKEGVDLSLGANVGYMDYDEEGMYAGFDGISDYNFTAGISADAGNGLGISISATQTISGDDEINVDDEFWTMAALSYEL
jgi:uncharacterized protein (TIGR02001 family)